MGKGTAQEISADREGIQGDLGGAGWGEVVVIQEISISLLAHKKEGHSCEGTEYKGMALKDPLKALSLAVRNGRHPLKKDTADEVQNLRNLGACVENDHVPVFANEPDEQKEMKGFLYGPEQEIEIDPRREYKNIEYLQTFIKGAGMDAYLSIK